MSSAIEASKRQPDDKKERGVEALNQEYADYEQVHKPR